MVAGVCPSLTRSEPWCLVTTTTGQTPRSLWVNSRSSPGATRWCAGWALEERVERRWRGGIAEEVQMGTITDSHLSDCDVMAHPWQQGAI